MPPPQAIQEKHHQFNPFLIQSNATIPQPQPQAIQEKRAALAGEGKALRAGIQGKEAALRKAGAAEVGGIRGESRGCWGVG